MAATTKKRPKTKALTVVTVEWAEIPNFTPPCTARAARREFAKVQNEYGQTPPRELWKAHKRRDAPLHSFYEWDNNAAGDLYRDNQSRLLMRSLVVEYEEFPEQPPQQLMVRTRIKSVRGYQELSDALLHTGAELMSLSDAKSLVSRTKRRIQHLEAAKKLVGEMTDFVRSATKPS